MKKLVLIISILIVQLAIADRMDKDTHTLLIDKLERVLELMDNNSEKRADVMLRLADLRAERARLEDMEQGQKDADQTSKDSKSDRARAIELYQEALSRSTGELQGKVIFQMAQLYDLQGQDKKAKQLYITASKGNHYSPEVIGQAYLKLGDIAFNKINYDEAKANFSKALAIKETPRRDYIKYRLAWCEFHKGNFDKATQSLARVLKNPEDSQNETSFREEASRDLATFISRGKVGPTEVQLLSDASPEAVRHENLIYLSDELNRLGKKGSAVYVLTVAGPTKDDAKGGDKDPFKDKIEEHIKLAELQYDIGKKEQVVAELETAVNLWKAQACDVQENCELLKERFKKLVVAWGKAEEKRPSSNLVKAYTLYNSMFAEADMNYWAALAARQNSMWKEATAFYRNASDLAANQIKTATKSAKGDGKLQKIFEGSLLGEIEVAELAHDLNMRESAYNHYLEVRPEGEKKVEVLYQKAHIMYEQGKYMEAANSFRQIALSHSGGKGANDLREKAAHLSLDSLVLAQNDDAVQSWASDYAKEFHQDRSSFLNIAKKAVINRVAVVLNNPNASPTELREALVRLSAFPVNEATKEEKTSYYKNKLILAERLKDLGEAKRAAIGLLSVKGLSSEDRNYSLSRLEWIDELTLNFADAFKLASQLPMSEISKEDRILKLAMLAELSNNNPQPYYVQYLKVGHDREKSQNVIAKIVRYSKSKKVFFQYEGRLRDNPELLSTLALELYAAHPDYNFGRSVIKITGISRAPSGRVLARFIFLHDYHNLSETLNRSHLRISANFKKDMDFYLSLLKRTEAQATRAISSQDWVLQVIALNDVAYHYKRFALDLLSLSTPRGLTPEQRDQFRSMVTQQAHGYLAKGRDISQKIFDLWSDTTTINTLLSDFEKTHGDLGKALFDELRIIARVAPRNMRSQFIASVGRSQSKPAPDVIEAAKASVKQDPFDTSKIEQLKILEERAGRETIVAFLDTRLGQIQGVKR